MWGVFTEECWCQSREVGDEALGETIGTSRPVLIVEYLLLS
jgi:hypothetical protein